MTGTVEPAFFTIGSDANCDLVLADETVAPLHARLEVTRNSVLILTDCGQAPATKLVHHGEARPVRRAVLRDGDHVQLGDIEISVEEMIHALNLHERYAALGDAHLADEVEADLDVESKSDAAAGAAREGAHARKAPIPTPRRQELADVPEPEPPRPSAKDMLLPCARCGKLTDSLKRNRLARYFVFAWLFWWGQFADYTACAPCMRVILIQRALINLPGANIAWPIILIVNAWHFAWSFQKGHNKRVKALLPPD